MTYDILATLSPEMPHYEKFAKDPRIKGLRINTAMSDVDTFENEVTKGLELACGKDVYVDLKGRQLRIVEVSPRTDCLECKLNHEIEVETPTEVLFKAGADFAMLDHISPEGTLVFDGGPVYTLKPGESLAIRDPSLKVKGDLFTPQQIKFMEIAMKAGITKYMLSYVTSQEEVDEMRKYVGNNEIICKIENIKGLDYVRNEYKPGQSNLSLMTARGDLFVEVNKPHEIVKASREIINTEPRTICGSRLLLSLTEEDVPSCADMCELAWLWDVGYRRFMFCDSLCLKEEPLERAVSAMDAILRDFERDSKKRLYVPASTPAPKPYMPVRFPKDPSKIIEFPASPPLRARDLMPEYAGADTKTKKIDKGWKRFFGKGN